MGKIIFNKFQIGILIAFLALYCGNASAASGDSTGFSSKIYLNAGVYFPEATTTFQVQGKSGLGTLIFIEDFLEVDRHPLVFTANLLFKITRRSSISARYFYYNVKGKIEISEDLNIRDTVISIGAHVNTDWTNNYFGLNYNYSIFAKKDWSAGLSFGLRTSMLKIKLDYGTNQTSGEYSASLPVPIVLWGLFIDGYMAPRLRGSYSFETFRLSVGGISGLVYENRFGLEYYFLKNLGAGFSYNQIFYRIQEVPLADRFDGNIGYSLSGFQLNLLGRF